jgi:hypothetical protein
LYLRVGGRLFFLKRVVQECRLPTLTLRLHRVGKQHSFAS